MKSRPTAQAAEAPPPDAKSGLIAWWKLDEDQGACATDASGKALKAALVGSGRWAGSRSAEGGGLELDGAANYLWCDDVKEVASSETLSVALWFKGRSSVASSDGVQALASKGEAWRLQRRGKDGAVELVLAGPMTSTNSPTKGGPPVLVSKRDLNDGKWHHAAGTYDGKRAVLYIDGDEDATAEASGPIALTSAPVAFGENTVSRGQFFGGSLAHLRLYERALSADEVRSVYNAERKE